jgi:hypothetical protein
LGVGLLVVILIASGVLFLFVTRRRDERDATANDELTPDSTDVPDSWAEHVLLASGENALASEGHMMDIVVMEPGMVEEGF